MRRAFATMDRRAFIGAAAVIATAKALGVTVPPSLLTRADDLIQ